MYIYLHHISISFKIDVKFFAFKMIGNRCVVGILEHKKKNSGNTPNSHLYIGHMIGVDPAQKMELSINFWVKQSSSGGYILEI